MAEIIALVDDIFFQAKMLETAKHLGIALKSYAAAGALLAEVERERPKLAVIDLNARESPMETIAALRARPEAIHIIAFFSHVQTDLAQQARDAGCTEILPRSKFSRDLPTILSLAKG